MRWTCRWSSLLPNVSSSGSWWPSGWQKDARLADRNQALHPLHAPADRRVSPKRGKCILHAGGDGYGDDVALLTSRDLVNLMTAVEVFAGVVVFGISSVLGFALRWERALARERNRRRRNWSRRDARHHRFGQLQRRR